MYKFYITSSAISIIQTTNRNKYLTFTWKWGPFLVRGRPFTKKQGWCWVISISFEIWYWSFMIPSLRNATYAIHQSIIHDTNLYGISQSWYHPFWYQSIMISSSMVSINHDTMLYGINQSQCHNLLFYYKRIAISEQRPVI